MFCGLAQVPLNSRLHWRLFCIKLWNVILSYDSLIYGNTWKKWTTIGKPFSLANDTSKATTVLLNPLDVVKSQVQVGCTQLGWQMFHQVWRPSRINAGSLNSRKVQKVLVIEFEEVHALVLMDKWFSRGLGSGCLKQNHYDLEEICPLAIFIGPKSVSFTHYRMNKRNLLSWFTQHLLKCFQFAQP